MINYLIQITVSVSRRKIMVSFFAVFNKWFPAYLSPGSPENTRNAYINKQNVSQKGLRHVVNPERISCGLTQFCEPLLNSADIARIYFLIANWNHSNVCTLYWLEIMSSCNFNNNRIIPLMCFVLFFIYADYYWLRKLLIVVFLAIELIRKHQFPQKRAVVLY